MSVRRQLSRSMPSDIRKHNLETGEVCRSRPKETSRRLNNTQITLDLGRVGKIVLLYKQGKQNQDTSSKYYGKN